MFLEEFKNSLIHGALPTRWVAEAAVAATTFALLGTAHLVLDVSTRTLVVIGAIATAWFGTRIAIIAAKGRRDT